MVNVISFVVSIIALQSRVLLLQGQSGQLSWYSTFRKAPKSLKHQYLGWFKIFFLLSMRKFIFEKCRKGLQLNFCYICPYLTQTSGYVSQDELFLNRSFIFIFIGRYIFISSYEGNQSSNEKVARIQSPIVASFYPDPACFSFYYHMFGAHVGELRVVLVAMKDEKTALGRQVIWRRRGTQPDKWLYFKDSLNVTEGDYRVRRIC